MSLARMRLALWVLVGLVATGVVVLLWKQSEPEQGVISQTSMATIGGPFKLMASSGKPFSSAELNGKPAAVFFGFTHCPDVCPTTLARMVRLRQQLGAGDHPFEILFVTVDPKRDGPAEVGKYAELFDSPVTGLTGSPAQIEQAKKQFGIFSQQVPDGSGGYSVDHTATVLLFDRQGKFTATIAPEEQDSAALAKLRRITG